MWFLKGTKAENHMLFESPILRQTHSCGPSLVGCYAPPSCSPIPPGPMVPDPYGSRSRWGPAQAFCFSLEVGVFPWCTLLVTSGEHRKTRPLCKGGLPEMLAYFLLHCSWVTHLSTLTFWIPHILPFRNKARHFLLGFNLWLDLHPTSWGPVGHGGPELSRLPAAHGALPCLQGLIGIREVISMLFAFCAWEAFFCVCFFCCRILDRNQVRLSWR